MSSHPKAPSQGSNAPRRSSARSRFAFLLALALTATIALGASLANAIVPTVTIEPASGVGYGSAEVKGEVDPQGLFTEWRFQYIADAQFEDNVANSLPGFEGAADGPAGGTGTAEAVSGQLGGLAPGTTYHLRLLASNGDGGESAVAPNFQTDAVARPEAKEVEVSAVTTDSAHLEAVVNSGGSGAGEAAGTYRFRCDPSCPGAEAQHEFGAAGLADGADHEVQAEATGLEPHTEYTVKLVARNAQTDAEGQAVEASPPGPFTTEAVAPSAATGTSTSEGQGKVLVRGYVNPGNSTLTSCEFRYGPTAAYGQSAPCGEDPGAVNTPVLVTAKLSGLTPNTTYHFALVAGSAAGSDESEDGEFLVSAASPTGNCQNEAIRVEQHVRELPDCRAYELVSPSDKNGGDVLIDVTQTRAAADGDAVQFSSLAAFGDTRSMGANSAYIARRTPTASGQGWSTHSIMPPGLEPNSIYTLSSFPRFQGEFSADLSKGVFLSYTPLTAEPNVANVKNLYLREGLRAPGPGSSRLLSACPLCAAPIADPLGVYSVTLADATPDLDQVIFDAGGKLTADATEDTGFACTNFGICATNVYEHENGTVRLVGRIPPAGETQCDDAGGTACEAAPRSFAGIGAEGAFYTFDTISDDGSKVFFTTPEGGCTGGGCGKLYMRLDHARTVWLNASEKTAGPATPRPAQYEAISDDGSRVFLTSRAPLTDDADCGDLYIYDTTKPASDPHNLTCVYRDEGGSPTNVVVGISSDGEYLYFTSSDKLLAGQPSAPGASALWLYAWHEGAIDVVGALDTSSAGQFDNAGGTWASGQTLSARVSADGRSLLFLSLSGDGLTGYDHGSTCFSISLNGTGPCSELYLYRAGNGGSLACVSCNPKGTAAVSDAGISALHATGGSNASSHLSNALVGGGGGKYVFFDTGERLVTEDNNGRRDVYRYEVESGDLRLISPGSGEADAYFLDASPSGTDVFFATSQRLVGWDTDGSYDLYDARVGGGFPEPPPVPASCQAETCRTAPAAPPALSAASQLFSGPGNRKQARKGRHQRRRAKKRAHRRHQRARTAGTRQGGSR